jgi:hypothetical protein
MLSKPTEFQAVQTVFDKGKLEFHGSFGKR